MPTYAKLLPSNGFVKNWYLPFDGDKREESPLAHVFIPRNFQKCPFRKINDIQMSKINIISLICLTTVIFCTISADTGYSLRQSFFKIRFWVYARPKFWELTHFKYHKSKLKTIIMNAYNDEPTLHSKICRTDVSTYTAQLWDSYFHDIISLDSDLHDSWLVTKPSNFRNQD